MNLVVDIFDHRAVLRRRIQTIRDIQAIYMPSAPQLITAELPPIAAALQKKADELAKKQQSKASSTTSISSTNPTVTVPPEHMPLFLPSQVPPHLRAGLSLGLCEMESQLREGQMRNALDKLRVHLHIWTRLATFKARHVRHQRENMKAQEQLKSNDTKIKAFKEKYCAARQAKLTLDSPGLWEAEFQLLANNHVHSLTDFDPLLTADNESVSRWQIVTEGGCQISWI